MDKSLFEVDRVYREVISSIDCKYSKYINKNFAATFFGYSEEEVHRQYIDLTNEVSNEFCLAMFASVESKLRTDFIIRCQLKKEDSLSKFYRSSYNPAKRMYTYNLSEVIFKGWKNYLPTKDSILVDRMTELFQYRNWLAHGRYWNLPINLLNIDYKTVYYDCSLFLSVISSKLYVN